LETSMNYSSRNRT